MPCSPRPNSWHLRDGDRWAAKNRVATRRKPGKTFNDRYPFRTIALFTRGRYFHYPF